MFNKMTKNVLNVSALENRPSMSAEELKATFDRAGADIKEAFNGLVEQLVSETAGEHIGANVENVATKTLQAVLTAFDEAIRDRYTKNEVDTSVSQETNNLVSDFDINLTTGVITVTKKDGTKETYDTALEKVPAKFEIVEENEVYYLKITNTDGTSTKVNVNTLFNEYLFTNSDEISFEVTNEGNSKKVVAKLRDNSIGIGKLSLNVVSQLEGYVQSASSNATSAKNSATSAETSANSASTSANTATQKATQANTDALLAKSYAVGGTGTRAGEDTDNAKYYKEQAAASGGGIGGTTDYTALSNKPKINGVELTGDKTSEDLGITGGGGNGNILTFENIQVATTSFVEDTTYEEFGYRADIPCVGITDNYFPEVVFSLADATSGNYSPICSSGNGIVTIYAVDIPENDIIIPTISCSEGA